MRNTINNQSKNEVRDLLNEYVVFPINLDTEKDMRNIQTSLDNLEENVKEEVNKIRNSLDAKSGRINNTLSNYKDILEDKFEEVTDKIDDNADDVKNALLGSSRGIISEIAAKSGNIEKSIELSKQLSVNNYREFKEQIITLSNNSDKKFLETTELIKSEIQKLSDTENNNFSESIKRISELTDNLDSDCNYVLERIDNLDNKIFETFENNSNRLTEYYQDVKKDIDTFKLEITDFTERKYKILFRMLLSLGLANFLGTVIAIVVNLIA